MQEPCDRGSLGVVGEAVLAVFAPMRYDDTENGPVRYVFCWRKKRWVA